MTTNIEVRISFDKFKNIVEQDIGNTRKFKLNRFEYYECGAYGCGWCTYGFESKDDLKQYRQYLKTHKNLRRKTI